MPVPMLYDTTRLFLEASAPTPRGIDRVDLSYARHMFGSWAADCLGLLPTPWGIRCFPREQVLRGLDRLEELWAEVIPVDEDPGLQRVRRWLCEERLAHDGESSANSRAVHSRLARWASVLGATGVTLGRSVVHTAPRGAIYLNVGQTTLGVPLLMSWLARRPDIRPIFLVHDVIPLEHPEFVSEKARAMHGRIVDSAARYAAGLIVTSASARESVLGALRVRSARNIPVATVPLPVAPVFVEKEAFDDDLRGHAYFVVCGAIEPRKNHKLLLDVWQRLVRDKGKEAPRLIIVGSPGRGGGAILDELMAGGPLSGSMIVVQGLSSPALRRLVANARALLMPSLAEGFGLPIIEALAVGTPVIASDLPAHREVGGGYAILCSPSEPEAWCDQIASMMDDRVLVEIRKTVAKYRPLTAGGYFGQIEAFLGDVSEVVHRRAGDAAMA